MLFSQRFRLPVIITAHAQLRMGMRNIDETMVLDIIDTGVDKDNVAVVKTVMHHWEIAP